MNLESSHPLFQALIAGIFLWILTTAGASLTLFTKEPKRKFLDAMLGFAGGIMLSASFWSLLLPSITMAEGRFNPVWFPAALGFLIGSIFIYILDKIIPHLHLWNPVEESEGIKTSLNKATLLTLAISLHNLPEGIAVGVVYGSETHAMSGAKALEAIALTLGIGLQDIPEGIAVSIPLRGTGLSRTKSFLAGWLSGFVEFVGVILGTAFVFIFSSVLPFALSFAAGAMIYVVIEEAIPEAQKGGNSDIATIGALAGFMLMMVLDVAFG